jgi:hypothetical protein
MYRGRPCVADPTNYIRHYSVASVYVEDVYATSQQGAESIPLSGRSRERRMSLVLRLSSK